MQRSHLKRGYQLETSLGIGNRNRRKKNPANHVTFQHPASNADDSEEDDDQDFLQIDEELDPEYYARKQERKEALDRILETMN